jgi:hypothetical protein
MALRKDEFLVEGKRRRKFTFMIGDGKLPNLYWVSYSSDFYICKNSRCEWASEKIKFKPIGKTVDRAFSSFEAARNYAQQFIDGMPQMPTRVSINCVQIEDRLSGQVYECVLHAYPPDKVALLKSYRVESEEHTDLNFTKQKMTEQGQQFR